MSTRGLLLYLFSGISLIFFQNCAKQTFSPIDSQQKFNTLENHGGLEQSDTGLNGMGGPDQNDGGIGGGPSTPDGGVTGGPSTPDGGVSGGPSTPDGGIGGGMLGPGGMLTFGGGPSTPDGGVSGGPSTPDGGVNGGNGNLGGSRGGGTLPFGDISRWPTATPDGGSTGGNMGNNGNNPGGEATGNMPMIFDIKGDSVTNPREGRFNVIRWCRGKDQAATLNEASDIIIEVYDKASQQKICEGKGVDLLRQIKSDAMVDIPNCDFSMVKNEDLIVTVKNQNGQTLSDGTDNGENANAFDDNKISTDDGRQKEQATALHLLMEKDVDRNNQMDDCDAYNASPLVVDMRRAIEFKEIFEMTAPSFGVVFDILGHNSFPSEFTKKKISWFQDPRIMPIVLPNNGDEIGINQMFGDNTLGPDGDFADDGFAALAKYDGRNLQTGERSGADGYITTEDPIYHELRLWYDRDLDGQVDPRELISLERARVEVIDLRFDPNYYSRDRYGNEIKYKSVAKLSNGQYKPIFDVWFVIDNRIQ